MATGMGAYGLFEQDNNNNPTTMVSNINTVIAALIATVTFSAIIQPPGGLDGDTGLAKLATSTWFRFFMVFNSSAFLASMIVIVGWIFVILFGRPLKRESVYYISALVQMSSSVLMVSVVFVIMSYMCSAVLITIPRSVRSVSSPADRKEYVELFSFEVRAAVCVPIFSVSLMVLHGIFTVANASNPERAFYKKIIIRTMIFIIPPCAAIAVFFFPRMKINIPQFLQG